MAKRARDLSGLSFIRALILFMGTLFSWTNQFSEVPTWSTIQSRGSVSIELWGHSLQQPGNSHYFASHSLHSAVSLPACSVPVLTLHIFMVSDNREHLYDYGQWMLPGLTGGLVGKVEQWLVSACSSELPLCYVIKRVEGVVFRASFSSQQEVVRKRHVLLTFLS